MRSGNVAMISRALIIVVAFSMIHVVSCYLGNARRYMRQQSLDAEKEVNLDCGIFYSAGIISLFERTEIPLFLGIGDKCR